jgi:uncharacterized Zn finger protein
VPVTARLSQRFYEKLGEEATAELVNLLNSVDERSRNDLQDINQRNWALFRSELREFEARIDARLTQMDARLTQMDARLAQMDARFAQADARLAQMDAGWERRFADVRVDMMRWMFVYWSTTLVGLGGLIIALRQGLFG